MINHEQFKKLIIVPTLSKMNLYSDDAVELLLFTLAAETHGGEYLKQIKGIALGVYQMEPRTYNDIWQNYIRKRAELSLIMGAQFNAFRMPDENRLIYDLEFATAMARIHYRKVQEIIPKGNDVEALWAYYKKYWNTELGTAERDQCIKAYLEYTGQSKSNLRRKAIQSE